jgi:hypothetical protein
MSRLTEIQKAIEELALEERRNFATGSMDLTLLRNENGPWSLKSGYVKSSREKWLPLMGVLKEMHQLAKQFDSTVSFWLHPDARDELREAVVFL